MIHWRQYVKTILVISLGLFSCIMLNACKQEKKTPQKKERIVTAQMRSISTHLYYNGSIAPIRTISAISPADGRIATTHFEYGATINKDQLLVTIDSQPLADKFRTAISDFLTTKETLSTQHITFQGVEALYKAGIETKNSYITARSTFETSEVNYYQKKLALEKVLNQAKMPVEQFENLSISDTKDVNTALSHKFSSLPVHAEGSGVALFPVATEGAGDSNDTNGKKLIVGSQVKQGQLILSIGDLSGLSVAFKVGEVDINRIKEGLKVIVTGVSFPNQVLKGYISQVASQADQSSGSQALSQFDVTVTIPKITKDQQKVVHIGMTSKVDIEIKNPAEIMLPINAINQVNGQSVITVVGKDKKRTQVPVVTGSTSMNDVAIISGIKPGQKVVVYDTI